MRPLKTFRTSMKPDLHSNVQDQPPEQFDRAVAFLVTNYSAVELAGAYLNATSGNVWEKIVNLSGETDESTVFRRPA